MRVPRTAVAALLALSLVAACTGTGPATEAPATAGPTDQASTEPIIIGFPADLSSTYAYYDQPMLEGAQFAVDEINDADGVLGRQLELRAIDIRNDPAETSRVTQRLVDEGAVYLIGTTGDGISAQGAIACEAGVPVSTGDGTAATLVGDIGECAFQLLMNDTIQGAIAADWALAEGYRSALIISSPEIPYTANLPGYFGEVFERGDGTIVGEEQYQIEAGDFSALTTKIANLSTQPDVIYTPMFPPDTQIFMRQLRQAGVTTPVISSDGNLDPSITAAGAAIDGMVFTAAVCPPDADPGVEQFVASYTERYGEEPSSVVATLGYDEIQMVVQAIEAAGSAEPSAIMQALSTIELSGVSGDGVMDPETRRIRKPAALLRMDGETFTCLEQPGYPEYVPEP